MFPQSRHHLALFSLLEPPSHVPALEHLRQFLLGRRRRVRACARSARQLTRTTTASPEARSEEERLAPLTRTVEPIPRVAQAVPRPERLPPLPLRLVDVRRANEGAPSLDRVGCAERERDERAGGGVLDESREVEAACASTGLISLGIGRLSEGSEVVPWCSA